MIETPVILQSKEQPAAVIRLKLTQQQMMQEFGAAAQEIHSALSAQGIEPAGPLYSFHFRRPTDTFDLEVGVPVSKPFDPPSGGRIKLGKLPSEKVARTVYHGGYEGLPGGWGEFHRWMEAQKLNQAEHLWECYTVGPATEPDQKKWTTELNRPLLA